MKWFFSRKSMKKVKYLFTHYFDGYDIYLWKDKYGKMWVAKWKWGFRIPSEEWFSENPTQNEGEK